MALDRRTQAHGIGTGAMEPRTTPSLPRSRTPTLRPGATPSCWWSRGSMASRRIRISSRRTFQHLEVAAMRHGRGLVLAAIGGVSGAALLAGIALAALPSADSQNGLT